MGNTPNQPASDIHQLQEENSELRSALRRLAARVNTLDAQLRAHRIAINDLYGPEIDPEQRPEDREEVRKQAAIRAATSSAGLDENALRAVRGELAKLMRRGGP